MNITLHNYSDYATKSQISSIPATSTPEYTLCVVLGCELPAIICLNFYVDILSPGLNIIRNSLIATSRSSIVNTKLVEQLRKRSLSLLPTVVGVDFTSLSLPMCTNESFQC